MEGASAAASMLRARRTAARLSQEELAERCHVSERTIRNLERGTATRPRRETLYALAAALGLSGAAADDFAAAWREQRPESFLAERAREDEIARQIIGRRRRVREIAASHVVVLAPSGRWKHSTTRRTFEAVEAGVDTFEWMVSYDTAERDPRFMTVGDCVNVELQSTTVLPASGAVAFAGYLGSPMEIGEVRTIEYRTDLDRSYMSSAAERPSDREILFAAGVGIESLVIEVRFDSAGLPSRVFAVRRQTVTESGIETEEVEAIRLTPYGIATLVVRPASSSVYGVRWEWDDAGS